MKASIDGEPRSFTFFGRGGVLFVRLQEAVYVTTQDHDGWPREINSYDWWLSPAFDAIGRARAVANFLRAATGTALAVLEPGHPFEDYLRLNGAYEVRLDDDLAADQNIVVLAENRAHNPLAIEINCGRGAAILVPRPLADGAEYWLASALQRVLDTRVAATEEWPASDKRELLDERERVLTTMREKRDDLERRLVQRRDAKASVLQLLHVDRAQAYYRKATSGTPTANQAIPALWKMQEMLRDHYTKGDATLAHMLGIPKEDVQFLDGLANKKDLDLRHATSGQPRAVQPAELQRALAIGRAMVQGVIDYECRLILSPIAAEARR